MSSTASGDLLADRRADYAEMLFADGEHAAAAGLMIDALEIAPGWALGWFRLGEFHEAAGSMEAAVEAWRMAQKLDPEDRAGAALKLSLSGASAVVDRPPSAFVETLFDQYADRFDQALVEKLGYRVPILLEAAINAAGGGHFALARDLGCGTGLMGERLRKMVTRLEGFDISAAMLAKARAKGVYDALGKADLQEMAPALFEPSADLVTAADVFMYVGRLDNVVVDVARMLASGGLFAFSVEALDTREPFILRETRRYAHAQPYIESLLADEFYNVTVRREPIRMDRDAPVNGLIISARRR